MPRIHPNFPVSDSPASSNSSITAGDEPAVLTVWQKSLLLDCSGFTVYNAKGNLAFRVDNYSTSSLNEIVLMDAVGVALFTIRKKALNPFNFSTSTQRFTLTDQWDIYEGEGATPTRPCFSASKQFSLLRSKSLAHVTSLGAAAGGTLDSNYSVEGSFSHRMCAVYNGMQQKVSEIRPKEVVGDVTFGGDVFSLLVQPGFHCALAMAIVILLDRMFGPRASWITG
ncbi:Protein LURP-one-related 8 [Platanthera zijinensis]|uniref:Protein LURP-one-related 8 n=1 Tax=Platanthera zijinensis TaxID=2320716 RepID=A0AAP0B422_9ASPA